MGLFFIELTHNCIQPANSSKINDNSKCPKFSLILIFGITIKSNALKKRIFTKKQTVDKSKSLKKKTLMQAINIFTVGAKSLNTGQITSFQFIE